MDGYKELLLSLFKVELQALTFSCFTSEIN